MSKTKVEVAEEALNEIVETPEETPHVTEPYEVPARNLPVKVTEEEKRSAGQMMAAEHQELIALLERKKSAASSFKAQEEEMNARIRRLSILITSEFEYRDVDCLGVRDFTLGELRITRKDTGDVVFIRPLTAKEMQTSILVDETEESADAGEEGSEE